MGTPSSRLPAWFWWTIVGLGAALSVAPVPTLAIAGAIFAGIIFYQLKKDRDAPTGLIWNIGDAPSIAEDTAQACVGELTRQRDSIFLTLHNNTSADIGGRFVLSLVFSNYFGAPGKGGNHLDGVRLSLLESWTTPLGPGETRRYHLFDNGPVAVSLEPLERPLHPQAERLIMGAESIFDIVENDPETFKIQATIWVEGRRVYRWLDWRG